MRFDFLFIFALIVSCSLAQQGPPPPQGDGNPPPPQTNADGSTRPPPPPQGTNADGSTNAPPPRPETNADGSTRAPPPPQGTNADGSTNPPPPQGTNADGSTNPPPPPQGTNADGSTNAPPPPQGTNADGSTNPPPPRPETNADGSTRAPPPPRGTNADGSTNPPPQGTSPAGSGTPPATQVSCAAGYFDKQGVCTKCPFGSYKSTTGGEKCTRCAAGTTTSAEGATSADSCSVDITTLPSASVQITLGMDISTYNNNPSTFTASLVSDIATALKVPEDRVQIDSVSAGSVVVKSRLYDAPPGRDGETASGSELASNLQQQAADPNSDLHQGSVTKYANDVEEIKARNLPMIIGIAAGAVVAVGIIAAGVAVYIHKSKMRAMQTQNPPAIHQTAAGKSVVVGVAAGGEECDVEKGMAKGGAVVVGQPTYVVSCAVSPAHASAPPFEMTWMGSPKKEGKTLE